MTELGKSRADGFSGYFICKTEMKFPNHLLLRSAHLLGFKGRVGPGGLWQELERAAVTVPMTRGKGVRFAGLNPRRVGPWVLLYPPRMH